MGMQGLLQQDAGYALPYIPCSEEQVIVETNMDLWLVSISSMLRSFVHNFLNELQALEHLAQADKPNLSVATLDIGAINKRQLLKSLGPSLLVYAAGHICMLSCIAQCRHAHD